MKKIDRMKKNDRKKLRIVHLCPYFMPELGYEDYYTPYFQKKMGHEVYVITSDRLFPFKNIETMLKQAGEKNTSRIRGTGYNVIDGIKVYRLPILIETLYDFMLLMGIERILKKIKPDIVQGHGGKEGPGTQGAYYTKKLGLPYVVDSHDFYYDEHVLIRKIRSWKDIVAKLDYYFLRKYLGIYTYARARRVIAVTKDVKDFAVDFNGTDPAKIDVFSLGADTDNYNFRPDARIRVRQELGYSDNDVVLFFSGIITRRKRADDLVKLFAKIHKKYPQAKLLVVGEGEIDYITEVKDICKKLGILKSVTFAGFKPKVQLPDYMSAADVGIWLSNNSVVMIEAIACALPIVIPDMQLSHIVGYDNGFKFKLGDHSAFVRYIERLIKDSTLRKEMSKNARAAVLEHYSYRTNAQRLVDLYYQVIDDNERKIKR